MEFNSFTPKKDIMPAHRYSSVCCTAADGYRVHLQCLSVLSSETSARAVYSI